MDEEPKRKVGRPRGTTTGKLSSPEFRTERARKAGQAAAAKRWGKKPDTEPSAPPAPITPGPPAPTPDYFSEAHPVIQVMAQEWEALNAEIEQLAAKQSYLVELMNKARGQVTA